MSATVKPPQEGRYRIEKQFPNRSNSAMYLAFDKNNDRNVVIKEVTLKTGPICTPSQTEAIKAEFEQQALAMSKLRHKALLTISGNFSEGNRHYLVTEHPEGDDLQTLLDRQRKPFPLEDVLAWADDLLSAAHILHSGPTQFVHNEIRPENIVLRTDGNVSLLPGGIAIGERVYPSLDGNDLSYIAIEQIWGGLDPASQKVVISQYDESSQRILMQLPDARTDIYALGATLYHLITAQPPVDALERSIEVIDGKADPLLSPNQIAPNIPIEISDVITKALAIKREYRFDSAAIMRQVLKTAVVRSKERSVETTATNKPVSGGVGRENADSLGETSKRFGRPASIDRLSEHSKGTENGAQQTNDLSLDKIDTAQEIIDPTDDLLGLLTFTPTTSVSVSPEIRSRNSQGGQIRRELIQNDDSLVFSTDADIATERSTSAENTGPITHADESVSTSGSNNVQTTHTTAESWSNEPVHPISTLPRSFDPAEELTKATPLTPEPSIPSSSMRSNDELGGTLFYASDGDPQRQFGRLPVVGVVVALLLLAVFGIWKFAGTNETVKPENISSTVQAPIQNAAQEEEPVKDAEPVSVPESSVEQIPAAETEPQRSVNETAPSSETTSGKVKSRQIRTSDPVATESKPKKEVVEPAKKPKVTVDDLINDN